MDYHLKPIADLAYDFCMSNQAMSSLVNHAVNDENSISLEAFPANLNGMDKKRKGIAEYAMQFSEDIVVRSFIKSGEVVPVLVCRFCCQSVAPRSDRIKEHLATKRHLKVRSIALALEDDVREKKNYTIHEYHIGSTLTNETQQRAEPESALCSTHPPSDLHSFRSVQPVVDANSSKSTSAGTPAPVKRRPGPEQQKLDPTKKVLLTRETFNSNNISMFKKFQSNGQFVDVTLWCQGKTIGCHKLVLAANSKHFKKLLLELDNPHPVIFLRDAQFQEITTLVEFMYNGEVAVAEKDLDSLYRASQSLQIDGLTVVPLPRHGMPSSRQDHATTNINGDLTNESSYLINLSSENASNNDTTCRVDQRGFRNSPKNENKFKTWRQLSKPKLDTTSGNIIIENAYHRQPSRAMDIQKNAFHPYATNVLHAKSTPRPNDSITNRMAYICGPVPVYQSVY